MKHSPLSSGFGFCYYPTDFAGCALGFEEKQLQLCLVELVGKVVEKVLQVGKVVEHQLLEQLHLQRSLIHFLLVLGMVVEWVLAPPCTELCRNEGSHPHTSQDRDLSDSC